MSAIAGGQTLARILGAIEGFYIAFGEWPSAIRLTPDYINHLQNEVLPPEAFAKFIEKVALAPNEYAKVVAENSSGHRYNYGSSGFSKGTPPIRAREWLGLGNNVINYASSAQDNGCTEDGDEWR
ncbi:MAG: hypothetical protein ACK4KV_19670 [Rhodocyclaceae bacterium]